MNSIRFFVAVWMLFTLGCTSVETSVDSSSDSLVTPTSNSISILSMEKKPGEASIAEVEVSSAAPNLLEQWRAPLKGDEVFFNPPKSSQPDSQPTTPQREMTVNKESIRLLGFVQVGEGDPSQIQAILRIDDRLAYCRAGDSIDDLEVVDISPPRVTLQSHRQRWDIGLFEQPAIKKDVQFTSVRSVAPNLQQPQISPRRSIHPSQSISRNHHSPAASSAPESTGVQAPSPEPAENIELPIIPELPDAPEFPELDDLQ